jgi:hypothetical protein
MIIGERGKDITVIEVSRPGPRGPKGADGSGSGSAFVEHAQPTPSNTWVFNHNMGFRPSITVFSVGGLDITSAVQIVHTSNNQVQVLAEPPVAGSALAER